MSNLQNGADKAQMIELLNSIKLPIMGAGGGFAPIGTINFFDASIAPQGWLACDGTVYNIADYPDLATFYASVHGSSNFYGGDGTTTFAVPDLRGEFLRGTGTNSHTNQGDGANVGVHQDGTILQSIGMGDTDMFSFNGISNLPRTGTNADSELLQANTAAQFHPTNTYSSTRLATFTSRPTNTSFLICVKATVSGDPNAHVYSTDEQVVGTTEDGEVIYEKTYKNLSISVPSTGWQEQALSISNMKSLIKCDLYHNADGGTYTSIYYPTEVSIASGNYLGIRSNGLARTIVKIVLQYTKNQ